MDNLSEFRLMFAPDPFDLAPGAGRHTPAGWIALAAGLLFAALCTVPFLRTVQSLTRAEQVRLEASNALKAKTDAEAAARLAKADPVTLQRIKTQQALQNQLRMSWTSLFDALEAASAGASGGATILSLTPIAPRADAAEIAITAMATSVPVMLTYVRSLQASEHMREVRLTTQQPATSGGVSTVRFQLSLLWVPVAAPTVAASDSPIGPGARK
jgi:Tfp pilus assembly protein PilN